MAEPGRLRILDAPAGQHPAERFAIGGDYLPALLAGSDDSDRCGAMAARLEPLVQDVGCLVLNLECPVGVDDLEPAPKPGTGDPMRAGAVALDYLSPLSVGAVGLANNHIYDFGPDGVARTRRALDERGIPCLGAGRRTSDEPEVLLLSVGPARIGLWNAANVTTRPAGRQREGVEPVTTARGRRAIERMATLDATLRVALVHAGAESTNRPDPADKDAIDALVEAGFDVVAACHSHRISGFQAGERESGGGGLSFYGLGSVSSGVVYSPLEREGMLVVVGLDDSGRLLDAEIRTIQLRDDGWGDVPDAASGRALAQRIEAISREVADGSFRSAFYRDMSGGLVKSQLRDAVRAYRNAGVRGLIAKLRRARIKHLRRLLFRLWRRA
ncbi:MAG: hypothetical protein QOD66_1859 [Solirubrobacteraceae bacterium]|nr:hypothetical protein [Solirubrobacteraceae bacterium]